MHGEHACRRKAELQTAAAAASAELAALRSAHTVAETAARKAKRKAVQEVEAAIAEYDRDVSERHAELQTEQAALEELSEQLAVRSRTYLRLRLSRCRWCC